MGWAAGRAGNRTELSRCRTWWSPGLAAAWHPEPVRQLHC